MIYPKFLSDGSKIGVFAPSDGNSCNLDEIRLNFAVSNMQKRNFKIKVMDSCHTSNMGRSTTGKKRNEEFETLLEDKNCDLIISLSGGDFLCEMLPYINFDVIARNPKWIQGYSDPTSLLYIITTNLDIATIYSNNFKTFSMKKFHESLENNIKILRGDIIKQESFEKYASTFNEYKVGDEEYVLDSDDKWENLENKESIEFEGRIIGGCIDILIEIVGTRFDKTKEFIEKYKDDGIIWYFDNCELTLEQLIRAFFRLNEAGWLKYVNGIVFGRNLTNKSYYDITFKEAIMQSFAKLNVPIILNADIGHVAPQFTIINGAYAKIKNEGNKGSVEFYLK